MIEPYIGMLYIEPFKSPQTDFIEKRELVQLSVNRMKAYQRVNQLFSQSEDVEGKDWDKNINEAVKICNEFNCFSEDKNEFWIYDNSAHFFLEMVYAESDEKILEFIKYQSQLFKARFEVLVKDDDNRVVKMYQALLGGKIQPVTQKDWDEKGIQIILGTGKSTLKKFNNVKAYQQFYKVFYLEYQIQFFNVLYSVSHLSTYLEKGWAYIHIEELKKCVTDVFITRMKKRMQKIATKGSYQQIRSDEQMQEIFQKILSADSGQLGKQFTPLDSDDLNANTVRQFSRSQILHQFRYFPLCMEYLIDRMEENKHLKHQGRQQIQLFFKSAGMKVGESIKYIRSVFQQKISESDFDKNYLYNIRHNYGLEGKRENYQCYSCGYNLKQIPGNDEFHGCPFKNLNNDNLEKYLRSKKYWQADIDAIIQLKQGNHFQKACTLLWHVKNVGSESNLIIDNPVVFYKESLAHHKKIKLQVEPEK